MDNQKLTQFVNDVFTGKVLLENSMIVDDRIVDGAGGKDVSAQDITAAAYDHKIVSPKEILWDEAYKIVLEEMKRLIKQKSV